MRRQNENVRIFLMWNDELHNDKCWHVELKIEEILKCPGEFIFKLIGFFTLQINFEKFVGITFDAQHKCNHFKCTANSFDDWLEIFIR